MRVRTDWRIVLAALATLATAVGCGGGDEPAPGGGVGGGMAGAGGGMPAPELTSIQLSPATGTLKIGTLQTVNLNAEGTFSDGHKEDVTAAVENWTSSNPLSAVVDLNGVVALGPNPVPGTVEIMATIAAINSSKTVITVQPDDRLVAITVTPAMATVQKGNPQQFTALGSYANGTSTDLTTVVQWASSDPNVATINAGGLATAHAAGTATISALDPTNPMVQAGQATITVPDATLVAIAVDPSSKSLAPGDEFQFTATGTYSDRSTQPVGMANWSVEDTNIATVDNGLVTAVATGTTKVMAMAAGKMAEATVIVTEEPPMSLGITPATHSLRVGQTHQLSAQATFAIAPSRDVTSQATWQSSDPSKVQVTASGEVRADALTAGSPVTITATYMLGGVTVMGMAMITVEGGELQSIEVTPASSPPLAKGLTQNYTATGTYSDNTTQDLTEDPNIVWASSSMPAATISNVAGSRGQVTSVGAGVTQITATYNDGTNAPISSSPVALQTTDATVVSIEVSPSAPSSAATFAVRFTATATFSDSTTGDITDQVVWTSSSETAATISNMVGSKGVASTLAPGVTTVTATHTAGTTVTTGTAELTVTDVQLVAIDVQPSSVTINQGETHQYSATGRFSDGSTADLTRDPMTTWTTTDSAKATVSNAAGSEGLATGLAFGTVSVEATRGSIKGSTSLLIKSQVVTGLTANIDVSILPEGRTGQITVLANYADGGDPRDVTDQATYTVVSSLPNETVASVSNASGSHGLVTGLEAGAAQSAQADITVAFGGQSAMLKVTVFDCAFNAVTVSPAGKTIPRGGEQQYKAMAAYPACGPHVLTGSSFDVTDSVLWTSGNAAVAQVSNTAGSKGLATVLDTATAGQSSTITATLGTLSGAQTLTATAACAQSVSVTPLDPTIPVGVTKQLTTTVTLSDATSTTSYGSLKFVGDGSSAVDVGETTGLIEGRAAGTEAVTVTVDLGACPGISTPTATTTFTVSQATLSSITLTPASTTIARGETASFTATGNYSDGTEHDITDAPATTWDTVNHNIATALTKGMIQANAIMNDGTTSVTATHGLVTGISALTVQAKTLTKIEIGLDSSVAGLNCVNASGAFPVGVDLGLFATATYSDASTADVSDSVAWSSADNGIASFKTGAQRDNYLHTNGAGFVALDACLSGVCASASQASGPELAARTVTVDGAIALASVDIRSAGTVGAMTIGTSQQYQAVAAYDDAGTTRECDVTTTSSWTAEAPNPAGILSVSSSAPNEGLATAGAIANGGTANLKAVFLALSDVQTVVVSGTCYNALNITPATATVAAGFTTGLAASATQTDGSSNTPSGIIWDSMNTAICTVAGGGTVSGVAAGTCPVTATLGSGVCMGVTSPLTASASVAVTDALLTGIAVDCPDYNKDTPPMGPPSQIPAGLRTHCTAEGTFSDGSKRDITETANWSSSLTAVVTVSNTAGSKGEINTVAAGGPAAIQAQQGTVSGVFLMTVNAHALSSIEIAPVFLNKPVGFEEQLMATGVYANGQAFDLTHQVTWSSSDVTKVTVTSAGMVSTVNHTSLLSPATVTASKDSRSSSIPVTVNTAVLEEIVLTPKPVTIAKGLTVSFTAEGYYNDDTPTTPRSRHDVTGQVTWSTKNAAIATVDNAGVATGVIPGLTDVVATHQSGVFGEARVTVSDACVTGVTVQPASIDRPVGVPVGFVATATLSDGPSLTVTGVPEMTWSGGGTVLPTPALVNTYTPVTGAVGTVTINAKYSTNNICAGVGTVVGSVRELNINVPVIVNSDTLTGITVSPDGANVPAGTTQQYMAEGTYSDGMGGTSTFDITSQVSWRVTNAAASHLGGGMVQGDTIGNTEVYATRGTFEDGAAVTVTAGTLSGIVLNFEDLMNNDCAKVWTGADRTHPGGGLRLMGRAMGSYTDMSTANISDSATWTSSDPSVAGVDANGVITTGNAGNATITATSGSFSDALVLTVVAPTSASLLVNDGAASTTVVLGNTDSMLYAELGVGTNQYCISRDVSWSSNDSAIMDVSNAAGTEGLITTLGVGTAQATATFGALSDLVSVQVSDEVLSSVAVTPANLVLTVGSTGQLRAHGTFSNGTVNEITTVSTTQWTSGGAAATVGLNTGLVTCVQEAAAVEITATAPGSISGSVNVECAAP